MNQKNELTAKQQQVLREQSITELTPGALLQDFETLLSFVAEHRLIATGTHHLLPISALGALNARMSHSLTPALKRPIQKSYPHINGLFLLARATGLLRTRSQDGEPRFVLDEKAMEVWRALNLTEQYFTLLEVYLLHASSEAIGEGSGWLRGAGQFSDCLTTWERVGERGIKVPPDKPFDKYFYGAWFHHLALLELFGLIKIKLKKKKAGNTQIDKGWAVSEAHQTPFGQALIAAVKINVWMAWQDRSDEQEEEWEDDGLSLSRSFHAYRKVFQPYFPELQRAFALKEEAIYQPGIFQFKVSLGKAWRRIAVSSEDTLEDFSCAILDSVDFDNDHLHYFEFKNSLGESVRINHNAMDEGPFSDNVLVGDLPLAPGDEMEYAFDFGDNWEFRILLESIAPLDKKVKSPRLLASHGKAPKQYRSWDDEEDEDF